MSSPLSTPPGPVLIYGQSTSDVLAKRVAYFIYYDIMQPGEIAICVTRDDDVKQLRALLAQNGIEFFADDVNVGTFPSLCSHLLRYHGDLVEVRPDFHTVLETDSIYVLRQVRLAATAASESMPPEISNEDALRAIFNAKQYMYTPVLYLKEEVMCEQDLYERRKKIFIYELYYEYEKVLKESNCLDLLDLQTRAFELLSRYESVANEYYSAIKGMFLHDCHNMTLLYYEIAKKLTSYSHALTVAGNELESSRVLERFARDFPSARVFSVSSGQASSYLLKKSSDLSSEDPCVGLLSPFASGMLYWHWGDASMPQRPHYTVLTKYCLCAYDKKEDVVPVYCAAVGQSDGIIREKDTTGIELVFRYSEEEIKALSQSYSSPTSASAETSPKTPSHRLIYLYASSQYERDAWIDALRKAPQKSAPIPLAFRAPRAHAMTDVSKTFYIPRIPSEDPFDVFGTVVDEIETFMRNELTSQQRGIEQQFVGIVKDKMPELRVTEVMQLVHELVAEQYAVIDLDTLVRQGQLVSVDDVHNWIKKWHQPRDSTPAEREKARLVNTRVLYKMVDYVRKKQYRRLLQRELETRTDDIAVDTEQVEPPANALPLPEVPAKQDELAQKEEEKQEKEENSSILEEENNVSLESIQDAPLPPLPEAPQYPVAVSPAAVVEYPQPLQPEKPKDRPIDAINDSIAGIASDDYLVLLKNFRDLEARLASLERSGIIYQNTAPDVSVVKEHMFEEDSRAAFDDIFDANYIVGQREGATTSMANDEDLEESDADDEDDENEDNDEEENASLEYGQSQTSPYLASPTTPRRVQLQVDVQNESNLTSRLAAQAELSALNLSVISQKEKDYTDTELEQEMDRLIGSASEVGIPAPAQQADSYVVPTTHVQLHNLTPPRRTMLSPRGGESDFPIKPMSPAIVRLQLESGVTQPMTPPRQHKPTGQYGNHASPLSLLNVAMSPTRAIHVVKMLKTGRTFMRLPSKSNSKQKLVHVFLSFDDEYLCFVSPDYRKHFVSCNPPKNKVSISSIKLVQRGIDAGMRRQAAGLSSGSQVDIMQDRLFSIIYSSKNHSLDLLARSKNERDLWADAWAYLAATHGLLSNAPQPLSSGGVAPFQLGQSGFS